MHKKYFIPMTLKIYGSVLAQPATNLKSRSIFLSLNSLLTTHFSLLILHSSLFTLHFSLFTSVLASPIQIEVMIQDFEIQNLTHRGFNLLDTWITKFNHLATIDTDEVIMLLEAK